MTTKKCMIWFSGTGTSVEETDDIFEGLMYDKLIIISGVWTPSMSADARHMTPSNQYEWTYNLSRLTSGYDEATNLVSMEQGIFKLMEYIEKDVTPEDDVHLFIGGHSRGAAVGVTAMLSALCNAIEAEKIRAMKQRDREEHPLLDSLSHMSLIVVDPVQGKGNKNDMLGLEGVQYDIETLLNYIEKASGKDNFITVVLYCARFDVRDAFALDPAWSNFDDDPGEFADRYYSFNGGFRHSAMVYKDEEISGLYEDFITPISLLRVILTDLKMDIAELESAKKVAESLHLVEVQLMQLLVTKPELNEKVKTLDKYTHARSYGGRVIGWVVPGECLKGILNRLSTPTAIPNTYTDNIRKNGRFLTRASVSTVWES